MKHSIWLCSLCALFVLFVGCEKNKDTNDSSDKNTHVVQAVDLGLSVKWAECNIGANSPEEYGDYFAWGETVAKKSGFDLQSYFDGEQRKYNKNDSTLELLPEDDAAIVKWGDGWRMPTFEEIEELNTQCSGEWTTVNGVKGIKITSRINKNSIFLPATGYIEGSQKQNIDVKGYYWSSTLSTDIDEDWAGNILCDDSSRGKGLCFNKNDYRISLLTCARYVGCTIRPVHE